MVPLPAKLVVVARSDGQKEVGVGISKRANKPKEVRKGGGNKDERYEEVPLSDDKSKEWRTKLGLSLLKAVTNDSSRAHPHRNPNPPPLYMPTLDL